MRNTPRNPRDCTVLNTKNCVTTARRPKSGREAALNVTAAAVIKAGAGVIHRLIVIAPGTTSGSLTINDLAATSGGAAANQLFSVGFAGLTAGQVISLDLPVTTGIAVTAVPGGGSPQYVISYS